MTMLPLTRRPDGIQAFKLVIRAGKRRRTPELKVHEGYEWVYVPDARLRLVLADHDLIVTPGQAADFDARTPHWFASAAGGAVEFLGLFGEQGAHAHLRAQPRPRGKR